MSLHEKPLLRSPDYLAAQSFLDRFEAYNKALTAAMQSRQIDTLVKALAEGEQLGQNRIEEQQARSVRVCLLLDALYFSFFLTHAWSFSFDSLSCFFSSPALLLCSLPGAS